MSFGRIRAENQLMFLDTGIVRGLQSFAIEPVFGASTLKYIGQGKGSLSQIYNALQYTDLSLNNLLCDNQANLFGSGLNPINAFILKDQSSIDTSYTLISGYLNSYEIKYSPNQIPTVNSSYRFYNNAGSIASGNMPNDVLAQLNFIGTGNVYDFETNYIANTNYINLTLNEYNNSRVTDFVFSINMNRLPIYNIGSRYPKKIDLIYPINVSCDITFEIDEDFNDIDLASFPTDIIKQNILVQVYANQSNTLFSTYKFNNMTLVSNKRGLNVDNNLTIVRKYVGQIFGYDINVTGLSNILDFGFVVNSPDLYLDLGYVTSVSTSNMDFGTVL